MAEEKDKDSSAVMLESVGSESSPKKVIAENIDTSALNYVDGKCFYKGSRFTLLNSLPICIFPSFL